MITQEDKTVDKRHLAVQLDDYVGFLEVLTQKVDILTDDLYISYAKRLDLTDKIGQMEAESNLRMARIRIDVICDYMTKIRKIMPELLKSAQSLYDALAAEQATENC